MDWYTIELFVGILLRYHLHFKTKGLYYDRRKNYYKNRNKKSSEIIGVPFLAQCLITLVLKQPDYARARPSSLLSDNDTYHLLYEDSPNLEVYYRVAKIGKIVKNNVDLTEGLERSEKSDILFYVLYAVVSQKMKTTDITFDKLKNFFDCVLVDTDICSNIYTANSYYNTVLSKLHIKATGNSYALDDDIQRQYMNSMDSRINQLNNSKKELTEMVQSVCNPRTIQSPK